jgi:hypothetical protein
MKKRLLAIVLAMTVVFAYSAVGVFAEGDNPAGDTAKLVKYMKVAEGVENVPVSGFKFDFNKENVTAKAKDGSAIKDSAKGSLDNATNFTFTMPDLAQVSGGTDYKQSATINQVFEGKVPTKPGVYQYAVTEEKTYTNKENDKLTFDESEFHVVITVNTDGEIDQVAVINPQGEKADPTDEPEDTDGDGVVETKGFSFVNNYEKTVSNHEEPGENPGDDPVSKAGAFDLKKLVAGQYADKDKEFDFNITVELPKNNTGEYSVPATKKLSHNGESLNVAKLPIGTKITVTEAAVDGYTAGWESSADGNATTVLVGEKGAYIKCTNTFDDNSTTPTGIIINNLPYVLIILLAIGGIVLFARKRRCEQ